MQKSITLQLRRALLISLTLSLVLSLGVLPVGSSVGGYSFTSAALAACTTAPSPTPSPAPVNYDIARTSTFGSPSNPITANFTYTPKVGGVALDQAANFLSDMSDITGAYYDSTLDRIVFVGKKQIGAPTFDKDDLAVAVRTVVFENQVPLISLENGPNNNLEAIYSEGVQNTRFGKVLFDADWQMKKYAFGYNENQQKIVSAVPGYKSTFDRYLENNPNPSISNTSRVWIQPELVSLKMDDQTNSFVFDQAKMKIQAEPLSSSNDPAWNAAVLSFAQQQTNSFDQFAQESPSYAEAKRLAKIVSIVKWIKDKGIATDFEWARDYAPEYVQTPTFLNKLTTPVVQHNGWNYQMSGGADYATPNTYVGGDGTSTGLKAASQAESSTKEDLHWTFQKDGQNYESVAVSAEAFRSLGSYTTTATDLSSQATPDMNLDLTRTYSSFGGGQGGIGRGWDMMPARLTDIKPGFVKSCDGGNTWTSFPTELAFQTRDGHYESFTYDCATLSYKPIEQYNHSELTRDGNLFFVKLKDQRVFTFQSISQGTPANMQFQSIADKNGAKVTYGYGINNGAQVLTKIMYWASISEPKHELTLSYNTNNTVSSAQDWSGRTAQYAYDPKGNLVSVTDPKGATTQYTYDSNNKLTSIKDRTNQVIVANTYTPEAKVATQNDANNKSTTFNYNIDSREITATDVNNRVNKTLYDDRGRITKYTDPLLQNIEYTWGADQYIPNQVKDKNGNITTNSVNASTGDLISTTLPDNKTLTYEYDTKHRLTKITDARYGATPKVTTFAYDTVNNIVSKNEAGKTTTYEYVTTFQTTGRLKSVTDPLGHKTEWTTSGYAKRLTEKNHLNETKSFEYDLGDRLIKQTDPAGKIQTFTYDPNDNLLTTTSAVGSITNIYNQENRLTKTTAPDATVTEFAYSPSGNQTSTKDAMAQTTQYSYDAYNNLTGRQDALNRTTQYTYDQLNRQKQSTTPLGKVAKWEYDANGNIKKRIDESNRATTYDYDNLNRLTKTTYPDSSIVTYAYDGRGNLTQITSPVGNTSYLYDVYDRLTSETDPHNSTVQYTYDAANNITQVKYPDNKTVNYTYDAANRLQTVNDWNTKQTTYTYNTNGTLASKLLPNGLTANYTYDSANRMSALEYKKGQAAVTKFTYTRDAKGNITKETEENNSQQPALPNTFTIYDEALRTGWSSSWSWSSTINLANTTAPYAGTKAISWKPNAAWAGLHIRSTSGLLDTTPYSAITFAMKASQTNQRVAMTLKDAADHDLGQVDIGIYESPLSSTEYKVYTIPLTALNGVNKQISGLNFVENIGAAQQTLYIDNIQLTTAKPSPVAIYREGLLPDFETWKWNTTTVNPSDTTAPYSGSKALGVTLGGSWSGFALYYWAGFKTTSYNNLSFALKGSQPVQNLTAQLLDVNGDGIGPEVPIEHYGGTFNSTSYLEYKIPLSALNGTNKTVYGVTIQDQTGQPQPKIMIDELKFTDDSPKPLTIYDDTLTGYFSPITWNNTSVNVADTSNPKSGSKALGITMGNAWGGAELFQQAGVNTTGYQSLSFDLKGSQTGQNFTAQFVDVNGTGIGSQIPISSYGGNPDPSTYKTYNIPLSALSGVDKMIYGFVIQDQTGQPQPKILLDTVQLLPTPPPASTQDSLFTYDSLGRVLTASYPGGRSYSYTYNSVGNRLTSNENGAQDSYTYNNDDQLTSKSGRTFTYDNQGNQLTDGAKSLTFNFDNKLKTLNNPISSMLLDFKYDGSGNRIEKTANSTTHHYVNSSLGDLSQVLVDKNISNGAQTYYAYGESLLSQGGSAATDRQYFLTDGLGNTRYITNDTGDNVQSYAYGPFGSEVTPSNTTNYSFQGQEQDRESGLTYLRARYYDSTQGRFIARDSVDGSKANPQSQNKFAYAHNNPINLNDPSGLFAVIIPLGFDIGGIAFGSASSGLGISSGGDIGIVGTVGLGANTGASAGVNAGIQFSNATRLSQLEGIDAFTGVSGGELLDANFNSSFSTDGSGIYSTGISVGVGANLSPAGPWTAQGGAAITETRSFNVGDIRCLIK